MDQCGAGTQFGGLELQVSIYSSKNWTRIELGTQFWTETGVVIF